MARQSPVIDHELKGLYAEFRGAIQNGLEHAASRGAIAPRLPLNGLAALLTSMIDGFGLQLMTEPDLISDPDMWEALETGIRLALGDPGS
jgi:hypothetical protein